MLQTIRQLLLLAYKRIDALDAELLLAHALNKPREWILAHSEAKIERLKDYKIKRLLRQRQRGMPLAYLTGHKEFFGLDFEVDKNVMIPRPDTEILVDEVLKKLRAYGLGLKTVLIDVGTGSGCIPIATIKSLDPSLPSPMRGGKGWGLKTYAIDISKPALKIARRNAKKHKVKIKFLHGNLLSPILNSSFIIHNSSIIITANLPYLTNKQYKNSPSIRHEPKNALVGGKDGLKYYKKVLKDIKKMFEKYSILNIKYSIFLEINPSQSKLIRQMIKKYLPHTKIEIKKDLAGRDRVVVIDTKAL